MNTFFRASALLVGPLALLSACSSMSSHTYTADDYTTDDYSSDHPLPSRDLGKYVSQDEAMARGGVANYVFPPMDETQSAGQAGDPTYSQPVYSQPVYSQKDGQYVSEKEAAARGGVANYVPRSTEKPKVETADQTEAPITWSSHSEDQSRDQIQATLDKLKGEILFDTGKAYVKPQASLDVAKLGDLLSLYPDEKVRVEGYADSTGSVAFNDKLSGQRADAVRQILTSHGANNDQIVSIGFGEKKPTASNDTARGRAKNRRAELRPST